MSLPPDRSRLTDLLLDPREAPDVEIKGWLDLDGNDGHRAQLAKAILALANHGGGFVVIGFTEIDSRFVPASDRPVTLDAFSQDAINAIVHNYAEPSFHCSVHYPVHPTSGVHPVVGIPGGHRVPIRARRSGAGNQIVQQHCVYTRRPGPKSEQPQTGREWDELFARCVDARRDELIDRIRDLLTGTTPSSPAESKPFRLDRWVEESEEVWRRRIESLPPDSASRCPLGFFMFAYELDGGTRPSFTELRDILRDAPKLTGWNVWWVATRDEIAPRIVDGALESWFAGDTSWHQAIRDSSRSDFWRVSRDGLAFLLRGFQEDGRHAMDEGIKPGTSFDTTLPIWRAGEGLLHAAYLADRLGSATVTFRARYTGLRGRQLVDWGNSLEYSLGGGISREDAIDLSTYVETAALGPNLVDVVHRLLSPLYELFGFTRLPLTIVQRELSRLRKR